MYKKVYIEITNNCNLSCDFCIKNTRKNKFMNINDFEIILNKLKEHTNYLYFHVLGEPLIHPKINPSLTLVIKKHDLGSIKPSFFNFTTCVSIT